MHTLEPCKLHALGTKQCFKILITFAVMRKSPQEPTKN